LKRSLSPNSIKKIDKSGMLDTLNHFPQQCRQASQIAAGLRNLPECKDAKRIVFVGVGGSAIGADLVRCYLYFKSSLPIQVIREYELPAYIDSQTLVFVCSYSGNTEETLSAYTQARDKGAVLIAISSGGQLKERAAEDKITFVEIPRGLPPRYAIGYLSIIPLSILAALRLTEEVLPNINQAIKVLEELQQAKINPRIGSADNVSKCIAQELYNKLPVVYSSSANFSVVVRRFRSQLNENSKVLASSAYFPEIGHNEITGWDNPKSLLKKAAIVIFRDNLVNPRISKRIELTKEIIAKETGQRILEVWSRGEDLLSRIFSLIYIGDFISYYLAILYGIDPASTDRITVLKERLKRG